MINTLNLCARLLRPSKPFTLLSYSAPFLFSNQEQPKAEEGSQRNQPKQDRAASFYRNTIRRVNTNEKGRGKFTEHHLLRLEQLVEKSEQEPLLFQAYNNYLGHRTVISSTTVDKMLLKSLSFDDYSVQQVIDTLASHSYYGYFPHYAVTKKATERISAAAKGSYQQLLDVFISSPLIKFNADIVQILLSQIADPQLNNSTLSRIVKLLAQREHYHLLQGIITRRELLKKIVECIEKRLDSQTFKTFRRSDVLKQWIGEVLSSEPHDQQLYYELAVVAVAGKQKRAFGDSLLRIKDTDKVIRCLLYLEECPNSFVKAEINYLNGLDISEDLRSRLQEFKFEETNPQTVQSE